MAAENNNNNNENNETLVLVTGATGFIASHLVRILLGQGYRVRGTARSLSEHKVAHLRALPGADERLELVVADLLSEGAFDDAVAGCEVVFHTASPYSTNVKDPQQELVEPALQGTRSVLASVTKNLAGDADGDEARPGVRRVVLTSSMAAITDEPEPDHVYTEEDWNVKSTLSRNPYYLSKKLAEEEAWKIAEAQGIDLVVINPFLVIGESLTKSLNPSNALLVNLFTNQMPAILDFTWGFVDVKDVALAHVLGMQSENARGRNLCCAHGSHMRDTVALLRELFPEYAQLLPSSDWTGPKGTFVAKLGSYFAPGQSGHYVRTNISKSIAFDNSKIRNELGIEFRSLRDSLRDAVECLIKFGHLPELRKCELSEEELRAWLENVRGTVPVGSHCKGLFAGDAEDSFKGSELVDSFVQNAPDVYHASQAERIAERLVELGLVQPVSGEGFKASSALYTWA